MTGPESHKRAGRNRQRHRARRARTQARQGRIDLRRLVFVDETLARTNMAPLRGLAAQGRRLISYAPFGHWTTMTFIGAARHDGIVAPFVLDGSVYGESFRTQVEQVPVPELRPDDLVFLDNLGSHKATPFATPSGRRARSCSPPTSSASGGCAPS